MQEDNAGRRCFAFPHRASVRAILASRSSACIWGASLKSSCSRGLRVVGKSAAAILLLPGGFLGLSCVPAAASLWLFPTAPAVLETRQGCAGSSKLLVAMLR